MFYPGDCFGELSVADFLFVEKECDVWKYEESSIFGFVFLRLERFIGA